MSTAHELSEELNKVLYEEKSLLYSKEEIEEVITDWVEETFDDIKSKDIDVLTAVKRLSVAPSIYKDLDEVIYHLNDLEELKDEEPDANIEDIKEAKTEEINRLNAKIARTILDSKRD